MLKSESKSSVLLLALLVPPILKNLKALRPLELPARLDEDKAATVLGVGVVLVESAGLNGSGVIFETFSSLDVNVELFVT